MARKTFMFLFVATMLISFNANAQELKWQATTTFDTELPKNYDSKAKIAYELTNDEYFLYIKMQINDETAQRQVMMSGLQLWFDTTKKYKDNFSLFYPLKADFRNQKKERPKEEGEVERMAGPTKEMQAEYLKLQNQFMSQSLHGVTNGFNPIANENGIKLKLSFNEYGSLIYNAKIPLSCFLVNDVNSTDVFSLRIKVPAIALPPGQDGPPKGGAGGPPPGGGGGRGQGGPPGGGQGKGGGGIQAGTGAPQNQAAMASMTTDKVIKYRFRLSTGE